MKNISEKLRALRQRMRDNNLNACIIPSNDPHQSEYVADHWKAREYFSGFTGSAGILVVLEQYAALWVDSRYFLQATEQLTDSSIVMHRQQVPHAPEHIAWLKDQLPAGSRIGINGRLTSLSMFDYMSSVFGAKNITIETRFDACGGIWTDRPEIPQNEIFDHPILYSGISRASKINKVRDHMVELDATHCLVTTLDDIAWLLNIRSHDIRFNPVCIAYLVIGLQQSWLFVAETKVTDEVSILLRNASVEIRPYDDVLDFLSSLGSEDRLLYDPSSMSVALLDATRDSVSIPTEAIIRRLKSIKNSTEIDHIRKVMVKDGIALVRLFRWLEEELKNRLVKETEVANKLIEFRSLDENYFDESFAAIVGYNGNGAIIHYGPQEESCADIAADGILLVDSGGQYIDGTTDVTRTIALGKPSRDQIRDFTLVLKGYITLETQQFPKGTVGMQLDTLARMHLWNNGLNYGHGTGHGVGFFLNVHEPPQGFATNPSTSRGTTALEPGMLTSIEPGYYKPNAYGIRTENLVLCVNGNGDYLRFEPVTLFPIDVNLIDRSMLTQDEVHWVDQYHKMVFERLSPHLDPDERDWLRQKCGSV